jgi:hypothetical protein
VLGINHYLSSERFLDDRLEHYPVETHGGNGRHRYADVLAARVCPEGPVGLTVILAEAWAATSGPSRSPKPTTAAPAKSSFAGCWRCGRRPRRCTWLVRTSGRLPCGRSWALMTGIVW